MTEQKEIGYEVNNVAYNNLNGYSDLWNKTDSKIKDYIVNEQGRIVLENVTYITKNRFHSKSFLIGVFLSFIVTDLIWLFVYLVLWK